MREKDPREDRLPKWAQTTLQRLRRRVDDLEVRLAALPDDPKILVVTGRYGEKPRPVARVEERVRFYLGERDGHRWIDVHRVEGENEIGLCGSSGLSIQPEASNTARIRVRER